MARAAHYRCGPADSGLRADNLARARRYQALAIDQRDPPRALISARSRSRRARRRRHRDLVRQVDRQRRRRSRVQFPRTSRGSPPAEILVSPGMEEKKESKPDGKAPKLERIKRPGKIRRLPEHLKIELDRRLSAGTFRSFRILSDWFAENGYEISHTALHKYGLQFDRRLESIRLATEQARIVCEQFKDDD